MCRLFGLTTGGPRVRASFWLLDAGHNFQSLSHKQPDGTGFGWFSLGEEPVRDRAPIAAYADDDFATAARQVISHTFVSHIRYASVGGQDVHNCHPFDMHDRLFAHNGTIRGLDTINSWLTDVDRALIEGTTDSELICAYVTAEIKRLGDTTQGLIEAIRRIGAECPVYSLNLILAEPRRLWALRYPESHKLWVLSPEGGGFGEERVLASAATKVQVEPATNHVPAWVVASQPLDDDPDWRLLEPGELLVIDGLQATSLFPFDPLAHQLTHADLHPAEAAAMTPTDAPSPHGQAAR